MFLNKVIEHFKARGERTLFNQWDSKLKCKRNRGIMNIEAKVNKIIRKGEKEGERTKYLSWEQ